MDAPNREIIFDGPKLYAGVRYYLLHEFPNAVIDEDSFEYQLSRHSSVYHIKAFEWRHMTEADRADWIYARVDCVAFIGDDSVIFFEYADETDQKV
jgi:hypothetical protein